MKAYRESNGVTPLICNLDSKRRRFFKITPHDALTTLKNYGIYGIRSWVRPTAVVEVLEKRNIVCPRWDAYPRPSSP